MSGIMLLFAGLFLPLFPLSMVFNGLFGQMQHRTLRIALLLIWPQIGVALVVASGMEVPGWLLVWALLTAIFYGFRALVLREVSLWISFIATSVWAVMWLVIGSQGVGWYELAKYALGFSLPLVLLLLLSGELEQRFGAAYTGLYNGLAQSLPRLSWLIVMVVLAVIATPLFPAFPAVMAAMLNVAPDSFMMALMLSIAWFMWGWAGARLIQGLLIGEENQTVTAQTDMSVGKAWIYAVGLVVMALSGISMTGGLA